mgnify:CR=1 FL=1
MAGLNEEAQWIVLMGFVVSFSFFFLAMILNQSTVVGQTTAESVLEFPKNDIRDVRSVIIESVRLGEPGEVHNDIRVLSLSRKGAVVSYSHPTGLDAYTHIIIHYNNGVTEYNENWTSS